MTISDSLPVQFWANGIETFNEKQVCGLVKQDCYCQPWQGDDVIYLQFVNSSSIILIVLSSDSTILEINNFSSNGTEYYYSFTPSSYNGRQIALVAHSGYQLTLGTINNLATWSNNGSGSSWTVSATPSVGLSTFASSKAYRYVITGKAGARITYSLNYTVFKASGVYDVDIFFGTSSEQISSNNWTANITDTLSGSFTATADFTEIRISARENGALGAGFVTVTVNSLTITQEELTVGAAYSEGAYTLAKSDCLDIRTTQDCTKLIEYTNSSDFDGLKYGGNYSPSTTFSLRVPCVFFEERNPQEQEDIELSNGEIVTIRQSIQQKRLLETGYMPNYMHLKLQKVLMHDTVSIDGETWRKRDSYDDSPVRKYNLKMAKVLLTKYDSVEKNTI